MFFPGAYENKGRELAAHSLCEMGERGSTSGPFAGKDFCRIWSPSLYILFGVVTFGLRMESPNNKGQIVLPLNSYEFKPAYGLPWPRSLDAFFAV